MTNQSHSSLLPGEITGFLEKYHTKKVVNNDCRTCNSKCCRESGFALLENVIEIFRLYERGALKRDDYTFPAGMNFSDFVHTYFDILSYNVGGGRNKKDEVLFFHMRHLTKENNIISIPGGETSYWHIRADLFNNNPWMNYGCVFLNKKISLEETSTRDRSRKCIIHSESYAAHMTAKPIGCVFFTCIDQIEYKYPTDSETERWFRMLGKYFPGSVARFQKMAGNGR